MHYQKYTLREEVEPEGFGIAVPRLAVLFYVENVLLDSPWPENLQEALDVLKEIFVWVWLSTNVA